MLLGDLVFYDVDNRCVLPLVTNIQILLASEDVIHSFSVPSIGLKVDSNPAYLSSFVLNFSFPGLYYGSCRELCGEGHRSMSIVLEATSFVLFKEWLLQRI